MRKLAVLLCAVVGLSGCMSMRDAGIGLQTGAAGAAGNGSGGVIVAPILWVTGVALELAGSAVENDPQARTPQEPVTGTIEPD